MFLTFSSTCLLDSFNNIISSKIFSCILIGKFIRGRICPMVTSSAFSEEITFCDSLDNLKEFATYDLLFPTKRAISLDSRLYVSTR